MNLAGAPPQSSFGPILVRESTTEPAATRGVFSDFGIIHHNSTHTYKGIIMDSLVMKGHIAIATSIFPEELT